MRKSAMLRQSDGRWKVWPVMMIVTLCSVAGCTATVEPHPPVRLEMAGSTSMQPLLEELSEAYTTRHDYVSIDIEARGTRLGLEALRQGAADIALVSRDLTEDEEEGVESTVIGYDALAILVNDGNPVHSLTPAQVRDVFSGRTLLWSEVGGEEAEIQVISREDGSGTRDAFESTLMREDRVTLTAIVVPDEGALGRFIAQEPLAIGYGSPVGIPEGVRALRLDGVAPEQEAIEQGTYPLIRPFVLVTSEDADEEVKAFVEFALSPAGQAIVGKAYGRARQ
jgi:phosphate transport system substrate-binding protein